MAQDSRHSRAKSPISIRTLVDRVIAAWLDDFGLSEQSVRRMVEVSERFVSFIQGTGRDSSADISADDCARFIGAVIGDGSSFRTPATATMHLRRATLRLLFRTARDLGIYQGDPTLDLALPPRTYLKARPLTDEEIALCRSFSLHTLTETKLPAAWALAEATARTSEIPHIRSSDVSIQHGRVWIHGSRKTEPRWGVFNVWGFAQIERRLEALKGQGEDPLLVYRGKGSAESRQAASCIAISEVLVRAGLGGEPDVRPASVAAWAAVRIFEETGRIDDVARRLGMRSLDCAARLVDWDWRAGG